MTTTDAGLMPLILQLGRTAAVTMDVAAALGSVCTTVPKVIGVAGAVILLDVHGGPALTASDGRAAWLGELQQNAEMGPLPAALRTGRPMLTADLTRIGPPMLAAAAAECGLVSSLAMPIECGGKRHGALQVLSESRHPVEQTCAETLRPLLDVLGARLFDVSALRAARKPSLVPQLPAPRRHQAVRDVANTSASTTCSLPVVAPRPVLPGDA